MLFKNPEEFEKRANAYFDECFENAEPVTVTGLALYLGTSRETLMEYQKRDAFTDAVKRAKQRVELEYEKRLIKRGNAGDIFALKQFGWRDKFENEISSSKEAPFVVKVIE